MIEYLDNQPIVCGFFHKRDIIVLPANGLGS